MSKVLCIKSSDTDPAQLPLKVDQVTYVECCGEALECLRENEYDGLYFCDQKKQGSIIELIQCSEVLDLIPQGIALLDSENNVVLINKRLASWFDHSNLVGLNFYEAINKPDIVGEEPSPLATSRSTKSSCRSTLVVDDRYFQLTAVPILDKDQNCIQILVTLSDSTENVKLRQKMEALHRAGTALADLRPEEIYEMDVEQRIDLLKENILHYTQDLLEFDVVEIRLIQEDTKLLEPLLSVGIDSGVAQQPLYAKATDNGVTGFVAATGKSYLCEDTQNDKLYLDGLVGARSCLVVPLIYHEEVIGTFNVESPDVGAFTENDLLFVQSFAQDIAVALNTLELLNAQRNNTALQSVSEIQKAVALPIDEILNDAVHAIECYIGHDPDVTTRLRTILRHARKIKRAIQEVGQEMAPAKQIPSAVQSVKRPGLIDKRVLVIDADEQVRTSAHQLLERYGCDVETAPDGREAILMVRNSEDNDYHAIIADIRLPDIGGYELLMKLKDIVSDPPLILMTGFGYDPGHSIVKARQAGLKANALLFKPFRLEQLLTVVESIVSPEAAAN